MSYPKLLKIEHEQFPFKSFSPFRYDFYYVPEVSIAIASLSQKTLIYQQAVVVTKPEHDFRCCSNDPLIIAARGQ